MKKGYKKDFQSWKGIVTLKLLCCNIAAGRFDWKKYCTPQPYCGQEICVIPLHCSYGQIGYTVYFPYSDMPEVEYDWEMNKLTIDKESWENYLHLNTERGHDLIDHLFYAHIGELEIHRTRFNFCQI